MYGNDVLGCLASRIVERKEIPKFAVYVILEPESPNPVSNYELVGTFLVFEKVIDCLRSLEIPECSNDNVGVASVCLAFGEDVIPAAEIVTITNTKIFMSDLNWLDEEVPEEILGDPGLWAYWLSEIQEAFGEMVIDELNDYFSNNLQ